MREETMRHQMGLQEEALYAPGPSSRRSTRNLSDDFEANPENSSLLGEEQHRDNSPMGRRAAYLSQTTRGIDIHTPAQNLVQTFEVTKSN